jgi:hemerythrin
MRDFQQRLRAGHTLRSLDVTQELRQWATEHILEEDKQYAAVSAGPAHTKCVCQ